MISKVYQAFEILVSLERNQLVHGYVTFTCSVYRLSVTATAYGPKGRQLWIVRAAHARSHIWWPESDGIGNI